MSGRETDKERKKDYSKDRVGGKEERKDEGGVGGLFCRAEG